MMGRDQLKFHKKELGMIIEFLMIIVKGVWSRKNDVEFLFFFLLYSILLITIKNSGNYTYQTKGEFLNVKGEL